MANKTTLARLVWTGRASTSLQITVFRGKVLRDQLWARRKGHPTEEVVRQMRADAVSWAAINGYTLLNPDELPKVPANHGGKRADAGRPWLDPADPVARHNIAVPPRYWERLLKIGDGNASAGIRKLIDERGE